MQNVRSRLSEKRGSFKTAPLVGLFCYATEVASHIQPRCPLPTALYALTACWLDDDDGFYFFERKKKFRNKQLVQDPIPHICILYTYTNTYMPRFSPSGFFGPSRCLIPLVSHPSTPYVQCACVCAYTHTYIHIHSHSH